jgi:hypothetical protein
VSLWLRAGEGAESGSPEASADAGAVSGEKKSDAGAVKTVAASEDAGAVKSDPLSAKGADGGVASEVVTRTDAGKAPDLAAKSADAVKASDQVAAKSDAGVSPDAGKADVIAAKTDAGVGAPTDAWLEGPVQTRGRVKMAELKARADGTVTWSVTAEQRVKSKQVIGKLTRADGSSQDLVAESVGLAKLDVVDGAQVKAGASLAQVIYFEAWAKAVVKGLPTPAWRCEVVSASVGQRAECKVSVVTPRPGGGAQVTVAIEPRWFDGAADAVLRLAP